MATGEMQPTHSSQPSGIKKKLKRDVIRNGSTTEPPAVGSNFAVGTAFAGYTLGVGVLDELVTRIYDAIPGFTTLSKVVILASIAMAISVSATFQSLVATLDEYVDATIDVSGDSLFAPSAMGATMYVYRRYAGGTSDR